MDQTSSPALIEEAAGGAGRTADFHAIEAQAGEHFPDIIHLARVDRGALVSGWDVEGSFARLKAVGEQVRRASC